MNHLRNNIIDLNIRTFYRKKWFWCIWNETLARYDIQTASNSNPMASSQTRINQQLTETEKQNLQTFCWIIRWRFTKHTKKSWFLLLLNVRSIYGEVTKKNVFLIDEKPLNHFDVISTVYGHFSVYSFFQFFTNECLLSIIQKKCTYTKDVVNWLGQRTSPTLDCRR